MYANGIAPEIGDVVGGPYGLGDVLEVTPEEMREHVSVTVQWRTRAVNTAQDAQPRPIPTKSLTFIRRK
jgi:hypothetical protein